MSKQVTQEIYTQKAVIACSGHATKSPHPKIYLKMLPLKQVLCPYCNIKYIYNVKTATKNS